MIVTEQQQFFRVRTEESQEYSIFDFSTLRDSVDSIQIVDDCLALPPFTLIGIPESQVLSARSTNYSSKSSQERPHKQKQSQITRSLNLQYCKTTLHSCRQLPFETVRKLVGYCRCPNLGVTGIQDRAYGAMFGVIIGDAVGAYTINKVPTVREIEEALKMEGGGVMRLLRGEGTDQWELNVALSEGLIAGKGRYDQDLIAGKYLEWIESKPRDMPALVGIALSKIRRKLRDGAFIDKTGIGDQLMRQSWRNVKQESALGLMRVVPLVIWGLNLEDDQFQWLIRQQMKLIAPNAFSVELSLLFSKMLKTLIITGSITTALSEASSTVSQSSSGQLSQLWHQIRCLQEPLMSSANASNVRFPFFFAVSELLTLDMSKKDLKKQYLEVMVRTLSRGFNSDTNCSVVLALLGAATGYNNVPGYFRDKVVRAEKREGSGRKREYWSGGIVEMVAELLRGGPLSLDEY